MNISIFELFSIGIGPSSSHTVGPMRAALAFLQLIQESAPLSTVQRISVELYGSLALTGKGHGTDSAIISGLAGFTPEEVEPTSVVPRTEAVIKHQQLLLNNQYPLHFEYARDIIFHTQEFLPHHANGMRFSAYQTASAPALIQQIYYSVGGGFIVTEQELTAPITTPSCALPYDFNTANELFALCKQHHLSIAQLMLTNEQTWHTIDQIQQRLREIMCVMNKCIERGCHTSGILPGGLGVSRRAPDLFTKLQNSGITSTIEQRDLMNWLNVYALAVNEENAAGGRVVTAPTNGAAGVIPAAMKYLQEFHEANEQQLFEFFLTAGAIAILYKKGASISAAEVGCQGEIGVASSMAAGGITAALGGTLKQIENAAEIAMEHHLGMTCDPVAGLVQIPCIERNIMGVLKAVNAARLALMESGEHKKVSLDKVILTMKQTGENMASIYKETSQGGLAVNVIEC
ncbi:MAG: L-serine ammonia-lyase [Gammaproteobacteria bacterium]